MIVRSAFQNAPEQTHQSALQLMTQSIRRACFGSNLHLNTIYAMDEEVGGYLYDLARLNKIVNIVRGQWGRGYDQLPPVTKSCFDHYQRETFALNSINIQQTQSLGKLFAERDLHAVFFKGPLQQIGIYGTYFAKPAGDIDILVRKSQVAAAKLLIAEAGYEIIPECRSIWWRTFLGEQHFVRILKPKMTADIHHRIQQPGCPSPYFPDDFTDDAATIELAGHPINVMPQQNTAMMCCISLSKALFHREAAGGYLCDLAKILGAMTDAQILAFHKAAKRQGLAPTINLAMRMLRALHHDAPPNFMPTAPVLEQRTDAELLTMILAPWRSARPLKRRELLYALCDRDLSRYSMEAGWTAASETARFLSSLTFRSVKLVIPATTGS